MELQELVRKIDSIDWHSKNALSEIEILKVLSKTLMEYINDVEVTKSVLSLLEDIKE